MDKIYDSIFKTMVTKNPNLLIPLINEVFGTNYESGTKILLLSDEHQTEDITGNDDGEIITDSYIIIKGNNYHIECQSNPDGTIVLRMIEYDFHIALDDALKTASQVLRFPKSAVLYLRHNSQTPDEVKLTVRFPENVDVQYSVPIIKVKNITKETIIEKKLYFLLPYYIMRIEDAPLMDVFSDIREMYASMEKSYSEGVLTGYDIGSVYNHMYKLVTNVYNSDEVTKEVDTMRGDILYTHADELVDKGRNEVLDAIKLYQKGMKTVSDLVKNGIDEQTAESVVSAMEA